MKRVHMKIKDFKCEQCGYTCSKKQYLDRHIKHVPIQIKGFIFCRMVIFECFDIISISKLTSRKLPVGFPLQLGQKS